MICTITGERMLPRRRQCWFETVYKPTTKMFYDVTGI